MTNKERIIERLNKLKKMRENGEEGERTNAAALIEEIMRRHGISWKFLLRDGEKFNVIVFTKKSVFAEGMAKYMMYKDDFRKNMDRFFYAYLHRNDLLLDSTEERKMSDDEREDIMASLMMAQNIRRAEVLRQLEKGGGR